MTIRKSHDRMTRDEILEVLSANTDLFKDDPKFVEYIVDLAIYLVGANYDELNVQGEQKPKAQKSDAEMPLTSQRKLRSVNSSGLSKQYSVLQSVAKAKDDDTNCVVCGSRIEPGKACPNCGDIVGV